MGRPSETMETTATDPQGAAHQAWGRGMESGGPGLREATSATALLVPLIQLLWVCGDPEHFFVLEVSAWPLGCKFHVLAKGVL